MEKSRVRQAVVLVLGLLFAGAVYGAEWDPTTLKMNPATGEATAYDSAGCTAPGAQGYHYAPRTRWAVGKPGVTYTFVGSSFNDKASCIVVGVRTRVRLYQHKDFKGKTRDIDNASYDTVKQVVLDGWWNDTLSSIKVWKK